jgi:hypothetical protein
MSWSRTVRWALFGGAVVILLGVAWVAWQAWQVNRDLNDAVDHADAFRAAVEAGDQAGIDRELEALREASEAAADRSSAPTWSALTQLPVFGDDARGVQVASRVIDDLAQDGLDPLVTVQDALGELLPQDGVVPVDAVRGLQVPVAQAEQALVAADEALASEDPSGYTVRLKDTYRDLRAKVADAREAIESAVIATEILPSMLGEADDRKYLLVFQNNAEIRATGGLPGAVSLIEARDGQMELTRQLAGADFGRAEDLPLPLTEPERRLFDDVVGAYFLSSNMTPDVPRAAALWAARWEQVFPRDDIDGVITLDTVAVSYLLDATGPIAVDGVELNGDTVVDELLHNVYLRVEDPKEQDAFFADVAAATFERFTDGASDPTGLLMALADATNESRVAVHSFDAAEQQAIAGTAIAGEFITDPAVVSPQIDVTINDTTGSKMSYYLRYNIDVSATYCAGGVQGFSAKAVLTSDAPVDAAELPDAVTGGGHLGTRPGNQLLTVRIYGPAGGSVDDLTLNSRPLDGIDVDQDGRPVQMFYLELEPGQTYDLAWTMRSGKGQTGDPRVRVTPSILAGAPTSTTGAC